MRKELIDTQNINRKINVHENTNFSNKDRVDDGCYRIIPILNNLMSIHAGANKFELSQKSNSEDNYFNISYDLKSQAYTICQKDYMFDYYLYWNGVSTDKKNLNNIPLFPNITELGEESFWIIEHVEDGNYLIRNKQKLELVFDIHNYYPNNGAPIKLTKQRPVSSPGRGAQLFKLEKLK